ncbi:MAG: methylated-DNA--[protein]-cysteine S-methyltransferase [Anaerolineae bacterium]
MTGLNELHEDLERLLPEEAVAGLLQKQRRVQPPPTTGHRVALRRRLIARYEGQPPVAAGQIGIAAFETSLGFIGLALSAQGITRLALPRPAPEAVLSYLRQDYPGAVLLDPSGLPDYGGQLRRYARGEPVTFDYEFDLHTLTLFQQTVLAAARSIPYGQVRTYKEVAAAIGRPKATRAVGNALGKNPVPLMIPCHRVVSSSGKIGGYSGPGGVVTKRQLLALERARIGL